MSNQISLPSISALLGSSTDETVTYNRSLYSSSHPSPTYSTSVSPQLSDAHHLAKFNSNILPQHTVSNTTSIRSLILSPPESPEMKSSGYFNCYGTQPGRYDDRYYNIPHQQHQPQPQLQHQPQPTVITPQQSYDDCSCCIKPTPVYSAPAPTPIYPQYSQHRYTNYSIPYDRKPTAPSLPRLNTVLESLAVTPTKHFTVKNITGQLSPTGSSSGNRYQCPYCSKRFSRPSSLRIHTYSHTGEKPFVCTEPGCGRKFSVQSNMRRHLRVHRLGRPVKKTRYDGEVDGYKMLNQASILRGY